MEALKRRFEESWKMPDRLIINRILSGEKELFEILLRRNNQTLYRAVRSYLNDADDIRDTMQDAYLKAYEKLEQFRGDAAFSTWLVRIGINEALLRIRKQKRNSVLSISTTKATQAHISQISDPNQMNPEKQTIHQETRHLIENAIDQLPEKYKVIYILKEVEGMDNRDIAACLALSDSNVKVRLHRAKNLLKETLLSLSGNTPVFEFGNEHCDRIVDFVMKHI